MKISAPNQLKGTVSSVAEGAVNGRVSLKLADGGTVKDAIDELGLAEGAAALAIVKSTDVIVGVE